MGKQMLAYFFALRYITKLYKCRKEAICLGSITKCHVIRTGGGLQSRAKNKAPFEKTPSCGFFHNGAMVLLGVSFSMCLGWSANSPRRFARGGLDKVTPALQVVIVPYLLGEHKRVRNRMNSSKRFTVRYIGLCPC